jgi:hypothetical protein
MIYKGIAAIADEKGGFTADDLELFDDRWSCDLEVCLNYDRNQRVGHIIGTKIEGNLFLVLFELYSIIPDGLKIAPGYVRRHDGVIHKVTIFGLCEEMQDERLAPVEMVF